MVRDRLQNFATVLLLLLASVPSSGCPNSSGTSNDIGFVCDSAPTPSRVGVNTFTVSLTTAGGDRLAGAHISVEGDMSHPGMSPVFGEAKEIALGRYQSRLDLSMQGDWTVLFHITLQSGRSFDRQLNIRNIQAT
jgi:YtkA-like